MARFLSQRLVSSIVSIIGATLIIFLLVQLHNDPRELYVPDSGYGLTQEQWEMLGEKMGFNDPLPVQYWNWISGAFMGDFGVSLAQQVPVRDIIQRRMWAFWYIQSSRSCESDIFRTTRTAAPWSRRCWNRFLR